MKRSWYKVTAAADGKSATVEILDEIGFWGVTASDFNRDLKALGDGVSHITLKVNSPGGSVWDAVAIHTMLANHPAKVTAEVIGVAASAASYVLTAADEVHIAKDAFIMIHLPKTFLEGESKDLRKAADFLDKVADQMVDTYAKFMNKSADETRALLSAETWFSAEEAVEAGMATKVIGAMKVAASFDVRKYSRTQPAAIARFQQKESKKMDLNDEDIAAIANKVVEVIEAKAAADAEAKATADAEAAAAAEANADTNDDGDKAGDVRAEVSQIVDACTIAGVPEKASDYIKAGNSLSEVMADLRKAVTANGGRGLNTRNGANGGDKDAPTSVDVAGIYAKWNGRKAKA